MIIVIWAQLAKFVDAEYNDGVGACHILGSDGHMNYYRLTRKENIKHVELNVPANERVIDRVFHI